MEAHEAANPGSQHAALSLVRVGTTSTKLIEPKSNGTVADAALSVGASWQVAWPELNYLPRLERPAKTFLRLSQATPLPFCSRLLFINDAVLEDADYIA